MKICTYFILMFLSFYSLAMAQTVAVKTETQPVIDGKLEDIWKTASKFTSFKQIEPDILADVTVSTEAFILYDEENIYVAMKMYQEKKFIRSINGRKDSDIIKQGDFVSFIVDPLNNYTQAFFFTVNAANSLRDGYLNEMGSILSLEWDGIFYSAVSITDDYWSVEMQIPLSSINFQNKEVQDWNVRFLRRYAQNQESQASNLEDIHWPMRLQNCTKLTGLRGLNQAVKFRVTPYVYSYRGEDFLAESEYLRGKTGGEVRYSPNSSTTILATINPDYAQIETDKEVINVSDLPTEYPEKRPFFIESSDFYPGAAVNTRNIVDIKAGLKVRSLGENFRYDLTGVLDGNNNQWLLGNFKLSENNSYLAEIIGGLKNQKSRMDYNITTHVVKTFFDNRLILYNWIGTINMPGENKNEYETVTSGYWKSRNIFTGVRTYTRSPLYNPNIVGWNMLSNSVLLKTWFQYSIINDSGFLRTANLLGEFYYYDLYSNWGNNENLLDLSLENTLHLSDYLGNWYFYLVYSFKANQKFRNRNRETFKDQEVFRDAFSDFVMIDDPGSSITLELKSDYSKPVGFSLSANNKRVRKSEAFNISSDIYWKLTSAIFIQYSLGYINIDGSYYQERLEQIIHRLHLEYNITDKLNIRAIIQPSTSKLPDYNNYMRRISTYNVTLSWEYMPGSYIYFVFNNFKNNEQSVFEGSRVLENNQSVILKINKSFSF